MVMKTRSMVISALGASLLIAGTVMGPAVSRVGAQQAVTDADKDADRARTLQEVRQLVEKVKAEAAELREQLERERKRAEQAEREALAQRDEARQALEQARRQAEQALAAEQAARQQAEKARQDGERARYAAQVRAAQEAFSKASQEGKVESRPFPPELERMKAELLSRLQAQREALMTQLHRLDEEQQRMLEELARKAASMRGKPEPQGAAPHSGPVEQILQRLERMETRLDRLEKLQATAPRQGQN
jgi:hypothetical protein